MEYYITQEELENYIVLPKTFDWDLVDQELGFGKIFEIIPEAVYLQIKANQEQKEIFRLLTKSAVHYSFVLSIPKIKVHVSSTGINNFEQNKLKTAPRWDVIDLGISLLKVADKLFSDAIDKIFEINSLKSVIPFFNEFSDIIPIPSEFEKIYSINYSPGVFKLLQKFLKQGLNLKIYKSIKPEILDQVKANPVLLESLKSANVFFALYYASLLPSFVFLQNAISVQYDGLPWQKSNVLDSAEKQSSGENFLCLGNENLKIITNYIKKYPAEFPTYSPPEPDRKIQARTSGIYLT